MSVFLCFFGFIFDEHKLRLIQHDNCNSFLYTLNPLLLIFAHTPLLDSGTEKKKLTVSFSFFPHTSVLCAFTVSYHVQYSPGLSSVSRGPYQGDLNPLDFLLHQKTNANQKQDQLKRIVAFPARLRCFYTFSDYLPELSRLEDSGYQ